MTCAKCGADNREGRKFCAKCAAPLSRLCPQCGASNEPGEDFCGECAATLGHPAAARDRKSNDSLVRLVDRIADQNLDGERKTVTALFADIKGSMDLMEDIDPEDARAIVDPALKLMMDAAQHYGGYIVQSTGDGIFAIFGAPIAHEDHPQRALFAALRLQDQLKRYSDTLRSKGGLPLQARVGLNTGEVVVRSLKTGKDHVETTPIGHAISLAARMQVLAPVGSIAATGATRKLGEGYFTFKSLGPAVVKGVSEPIEVFEVTGLGPLRTRLQRSASRGYTKFVGREHEMEALRRAADLARQGRGQIVAAVAEPGVGKSRLVHEFKARNQPGWMVLEALSFSHDKASAYLPVLDLLHSYFGIEPEDDSRKRREKVNGKILTLDRALEDALPYLFGLLGLNEGDDPLAGIDAQSQRRRTLEALKRILLRESLNQPLMVIFEDLHWIDEETQAFLNLLADSIGTAKILLLVNYRPEYSHSWNSKTYYTQLRLDPLERESAGEMLDALLGVSEQTTASQVAALKRLIIEKTEGTPLFMEEIVLALQEDGALVRNGALKLTRPLDALKIPLTVQGILASRIDRLPHAEKELLQTLAIIGMEFSLALAREVLKKADDELDRLLNALQLAEFVYEQPAAGDIEYTFKHALTQEVAYGSLLQERRRSLHQRVAEALESLHADRLDNHYPALARHFDRSGDVIKATRYLHLAGQQAVARSAFREALNCATRGLELVGSLPESLSRAERELGLIFVLDAALLWIKGGASEDRGAALARARDLSFRTGDKEEALFALMNLALFHMFRGEFRRAVELGREAVERARETKFLRTALGSLARILVMTGEFQESIESLERALALPELQSFGLFQPLPSVRHAGLLNFLCNALWFRGFPDRAARRGREALQLARESRNSGLFAAVLTFQADFSICTRDQDRLRECVETFAVVQAEMEPIAGLPQMMEVRKGWLLVEKGEVQEGIRIIRGGIGSLSAIGTGLCGSFHRALLALAYLRAKQIDDAFASLEDALRFVERSGERYYEAELHRLRGELLLADDRASDGEEIHGCFRKAIDVARKQQAKSWELRATISFAQLLVKQGKCAEARKMLGEIHGWFTEGFDTADLKDANALLKELSS